MIDKRIETREITSCSECHNFDVNNSCCGNAKYSCNHPNGPGGRLTQEIVLKRKIHKDCPLPKWCV